MQAPMQPSSPPLLTPVSASFGQRRSISHDLARFSLDLGLARPGAPKSAHTAPYPSPPMSHSPPPSHLLSPKQDARQRPSNSITIPPPEAHTGPPRAHEQQRHSHEYLRQAPPSATTSSSAESEHFPAPFSSISNGESSSIHFASMPSGRSPFMVHTSFMPPHLPRRVKSHVASACVNCKKAHLACDVRRPCPRCVSLGKQDTCRDVQHKKRGRPRLRDDRIQSFQLGSSLQPQPRADTISPLSSPTSIPASYRTDTHRILKSQATDSPRFSRRPSLTPREDILPHAGGYFDDRPSPGNARFNLPSPVPNATAYLTADLVIAKSTESVRELLGYSAQQLNGKKSLYDLAMPSDRDRFYRLSRQIQEEITEREPSYQPPSNSSLYSSIQNVGQNDIMAATQGSRDIQETFHLRRPDGHYLRTRVEINLAKTTVFFIVVVFSVAIPPPLQFNNPQSSFASQPRSTYTSSQQISAPLLTSPGFLTPSHQRQLQNESSGSQSYLVYHSSMGMQSPMESRSRSMQAESNFPSLAQYANASAPSPASSGFPPTRRPVSPTAPTTGSAYEGHERTMLANDLQLPPLRSIQQSQCLSGSVGGGQNPVGVTGGRSGEGIPRRERIGVREMLE